LSLFPFSRANTSLEIHLLAGCRVEELGVHVSAANNGQAADLKNMYTKELGEHLSSL